VNNGVIEIDEPIHDYFELNYCTYLTLPRSILQSMPVEWQRKFVALVKELDERSGWREDLPGNYRVNLTDSHGRCVQDKFLDYDRGRTRWPIKGESNE
jgi:hypothetical protein